MLLDKLKRIKPKPNKTKRNTRSRKYGQVKLRHARRGVYSCLFAIFTCFAQIGLIWYAYFTYGKTPSIIGALGWITAIFSGIGLNYAIKGFKEREKNYITCKIGIGANTIIILFYIMLYIRGLF